MSDTLLQSTSFASLPNWSVQYLLQNIFSYNDKYNLVHIGDFLTRNKTAITLEDEQIYKRVTIKINNGGVYVRDTEKGLNIGTKKQFVVNTGQFLLSKIDARNGAFGVVPQEVDNAIITGNFWTFDVDYSQINPHFLALMTTTPEFIIFCNNASNGTTNRHYLQESLFLEQKIPLPSLDEQNRLIDSYNLKISQAEQQEIQALELEQSIEEYLFKELKIRQITHNKRAKGLNFTTFENLDVWGADKLLHGSVNDILKSTVYPNQKLSHLLEVNPRTDLSSLKNEDNMSFIPMKNVSDTYGKITKSDEGVKSDSQGYTKFQENDLIWARITPCMQNGKSAIARELVNGFGYGSTEYHVLREKNKGFSIVFAYHLLRTQTVLQDAINYFTGSAGQQRVPKSYLENLLVPVPPLEKQKEIANHISDLKEKIKNLKEQASQNRQDAITDFEKEIFEV